jgi:hypothetical protein
VTRAEGVEEVRGVEDLSWGGRASHLRPAVHEPPGRLGDERPRDGVDVAAGRRDPALPRAAAHDDVNDELLRRAAVLVDSAGSRCRGVPDVV